MLVLSRQKNEELVISDPKSGLEIIVAISDIRGDKVRLCVTAPRDIVVDRREVHEAKKSEARAAERALHHERIKRGDA